jgi:hypothetical protein
MRTAGSALALTILLSSLTACSTAGSSAPSGLGVPNLYVILKNNTANPVYAAACRHLGGHHRAGCNAVQRGTLAPGTGRAFDLSPPAIPGSLPSVLKVNSPGTRPRCLKFAPSNTPRRLNVNVSSLPPDSC